MSIERTGSTHSMAASQWAKVYVDLFEDGALHELVETHGTAVWGVWVFLILRHRTHHNDDGWVKCSTRLAMTTTGDSEKRPGLFADMQRLGLVDIKGDPAASDFLIRPKNIGDLQAETLTRKSPNKTGHTASEKATRPSAPHPKGVSQHSDNRPSGTKSPTPSSTPDPYIDKTTQNNTRQDTNTTGRGSSPASGDWAGIAKRVFDHWKTVCAKPPQTKLTKERRNKVYARLRDGFTERDLCAAVDHYAADPFHRGDNDRSKAFLDLATLLRNETKVSSALEAMGEGDVSVDGALSQRKTDQYINDMNEENT